MVENKGIGNDGAIGGRGSGGQGSGYEVTRRLKINGFQSDPTLTILRDVGQKKTGKCGNFEKTVYPNPTSIFLLFLTWETTQK